MVNKVVKHKLTIAEHSQTNEKDEEKDFYIFDCLRHDLYVNGCAGENPQPKVKVNPNEDSHY
jgi:hypothetical protein